MEDLPKILVMSGGGVKGICIVGALMILDRANYLREIKTYAGTSIGALIATMMTIGYKPDEILNALTNIKLENLMREIDLISIFRQHLNEKKAIVKESWSTNIFDEILKKKGLEQETTMLDLHKKGYPDLFLCTVARNAKKVRLLNYKTDPYLTIIDALKMSTCIPGVFTSPVYRDTQYWDGGILDNYPISWFPAKDVLGIRINKRPDLNREDHENLYPHQSHVGTSTIFSEILDSYYAIMEEVESLRLRGLCFREICIDCHDIHTLYVYVSPTNVKNMVLSGILHASQFLSNPVSRIHVPSH